MHARIMKQELLSIVIHGFEAAHKAMDPENGNSGNELLNTKKSAKFVFETANRLFARLALTEPLFRLNVQGVNDKGEKSPGEWLYDACITKRVLVEDPVKDKSRALINTEILWAVESEFHTSMEEFAKDFGKLLCVRARNILYLQGLNQQYPKTQADFIARRLASVKNLITRENLDLPTLFIGFWPSPEKTAKDASQWYPKEKEGKLTDWIRLFEWRPELAEFEEALLPGRESNAPAP